MSIMKSNESGSTKSLAEVRQEFSEARALLDQQRDSLRDELASEQRRAISASTTSDSKARAIGRARIDTCAASLAAVEGQLRDFSVREAESEIGWAMDRAARLEVEIPRLEARAREAHAGARKAEESARQSVIEAMQAAGATDSALSAMRSDLEHTRRVIGAARVALAYLNPPPADPRVASLPLAQRLGRFIVTEQTCVHGRSVEAGEIVELPGPEAVGFVTAAKHAPDQPTPLRSMVEMPVTNPGPLAFLNWIAAPPRPEPKPLDIPSAELAPPKRIPPPRRVRALTDIRVNGKGVVAGQILDLDAKTAADLAGNSNVEACP